MSYELASGVEYDVIRALRGRTQGDSCGDVLDVLGAGTMPQISPGRKKTAERKRKAPSVNGISMFEKIADKDAMGSPRGALR